MTQENVVGEWVKCPFCGSSYLIDYTAEEQNVTRADYYFRAKDSFHDFQAACLDMMMKASPADVLHAAHEESKVCCYLPAVADIGGEGCYNAFYIGEEEFRQKNAANEILCRDISNKDSVLGYRQRKKRKAGGQLPLETVNLNEQEYNERVSRGDIVTNEIHYFPFYYWELTYKGKAMSFMSLGNANDIVCHDLPYESQLADSNKPRYITASDCSENASICGWIFFAAVPVIVLCFYVFPAHGETIMQWISSAADIPAKLKKMGWAFWLIAALALPFAFFIIAISLSVLSPIIRAICGIVNIIITFVGNMVAQICARGANLFKRHKYLNTIMPIQRKKQADARARFGITLNDLHIDKAIPPFSFTD